MGKVVWTPENDRKLLIRLIDKSAKSYNSEALCELFEGATPKAIEERIAKLKREAKALDSRCAVQPSAPHKPKGNYYTAPPVPGQHYGGTKRKITQTQEEKKDEGQESEKEVDGKPAKKPRIGKKKKTVKKTEVATFIVGEKAKKADKKADDANQKPEEADEKAKEANEKYGQADEKTEQADEIAKVDTDEGSKMGATV
ncbi:hypothetical protein TWF694_003989 [Orbilia ellipsospora]|uniref:Uncharacterized protein n=1 Tax=Orbilia ellipsospora TaxID=2528407 RepID=A0AAV9WWS0_9PEZI